MSPQFLNKKASGIAILFPLRVDMRNRPSNY